MKIKLLAIGIIAGLLIFGAQQLRAQELLNPQDIAAFSKNDLMKLLDKTDTKTLATLDKDEKKAAKTVTKADKLFAKASALEKKAEKKKSMEKKAEAAYNKALTTYRQASEQYGTAAKKRFDIYTKHLTEARNNCIADNKAIGDRWSDSAALDFETARNNRNRVKSMKEKDVVYDLAKTAKQIEAKSLEIVLETYGVYKTTEILEVKKPEPKEVIIEEVDEKDVTDVEEVVSTDIIVFQVQLIALTSAPLPDDAIREMFHIEGEFIFRSEEEGYYKYAVGKFDSYEQARVFKDGLGIEDAFIIAYINGQRRQLDEALALWNAQNKR